MTKCPFCHFENEEGALFCEQCKSDLGASPVPVAHAEPVEGIPTAEPLQAEPYEGIPLAGVETMPYPVEPLEAQPLPAVPLAETVSGKGQPAASTPSPAQPATPSAPGTPAATPAAAPPVGAVLPAGSQPRLLVLRGQKRNVEYPVYEGLNFIGRADEKPVDIDLEDQEPPDRIWCSRQHACISFENDQLAIEDLNSANGTYVNRNRIYPGQKRPLAVNDIIQIGNVQMKVLA
jgi:hypothetical protein